MYKFLYITVNIIFWPFISMKIQGSENIPKDKNYIIVSNHVSNFDPVLLALKWVKPIHFMAKEELFKVFIIGKVLQAAKMIPVRRGESDRMAVKESLNYLKNGEILGLCPEGTRNKSGGGLLPFHTGAAFFSKFTDLEVLPVAILGTDKLKFNLFNRNKVVLKVGKPIKITDYYDGKISSKELEGFTNVLRSEMESLLGINNENN